MFVPTGRDADDARQGAADAARVARVRRRAAAAWRRRRPERRGAARSLDQAVARALDVQGIAAVSQPSPNSTDLVIALIAAGAGEPDVVPLTARAHRFGEPRDGTVRLRARSLAARHRPAGVADVLDAGGLVVVRVDPGSAGEQAGIKAGDLHRAGRRSASREGAQLSSSCSRPKRPGETVAIEAHNATGAARTAQLPVTESPRLISAADQGLLFNPISLALAQPPGRRGAAGSADRAAEPRRGADAPGRLRGRAGAARGGAVAGGRGASRSARSSTCSGSCTRARATRRRPSARSRLRPRAAGCSRRTAPPSRPWPAQAERHAPRFLRALTRGRSRPACTSVPCVLYSSGSIAVGKPYLEATAGM